MDLQGLSREDYERRFSFDEQTLQAGGEQILNSDGDVGQALFSASAGLANLKERLDKAMIQANSFWMPRKKVNLQLTDLKSALAENKKCMEEIKIDTCEWKKRNDRLAEATLRRDANRKLRDDLQQSIQQLERQKSLQSLAVHYRKLCKQRDTLAEEVVVPLDDVISADFLNATDARVVLDKTRAQLKNCESLQRTRADLQLQKEQWLQQIKAFGLDDNEKRLLQAAKHIRTLADESARLHINMLLLDINMSRMDGFEFLDEVTRAHGQYIFDAVFIMLTTSLNPKDHERALQHELVKEFLEKPLSVKHIEHVAQMITNGVSTPSKR